MSEGWTRTTCPYCGVGCGVLARATTTASAEIKGDPEHPANFGRLCSKGSALGETLSLDGRLLHADDRRRATATGTTALDLVAARFSETIAAHGPDSVAFYVSGQLLTEDYYVANKLMKGFIGSANIDTNSRLCMASSVAGHRRAFGADTVPGCYEDLEQADLVVLVGSNLAWCHPVLFQRLVAARETRGTRRSSSSIRARTATTEIADLHLRVAPGADVALFAGLLAHLAATRSHRPRFVAAHTIGFDGALAEARAFDARRSRRETTELSPRRSATLLRPVRATRSACHGLFSQGVNQSSAGTDKVNAILNCHLATGRIGKPGMGPFSVTGQPNAMGGREVGGLANMLAAHMEIENPRAPPHRPGLLGLAGDRRQARPQGGRHVPRRRGWARSRRCGSWAPIRPTACRKPTACARRSATAPSSSSPTSAAQPTRRRSPMCCCRAPPGARRTERSPIPSGASRASGAFLAAPGEALPDWRQICEVARRMGFGDAFAYRSPAADFRANTPASPASRTTARATSTSRRLADISDADYAALAPFQWPRRAGESRRETRFFADGRFYHPDGKARFVATPFRAPGRLGRARAIRSSSTPAACATSGTR